MLHEKSSAFAGLFSCSKLFSPPALRAAPEGATGGDPQTPALGISIEGCPLVISTER
jgi:hypothetical protein